MKVLGRKTKDGASIGYKIELDAGLNAIVPERSLYDEGIVADLLEAGYQYINYQGDVKGPDGINVKDLAATEVDESSQDDTDAMMLYDDFMSILTEQEMQKYFTFDVGSLKTVDFREPIEILCKDRSELMEYLERFGQNNRRVLSVFDLLPVNAICAKEALFTLQDRIDNSDEFFNAMRLIEKRRVFRDKGQLLRLLNSCADMGIIEKKEEYTDIDLLEVYTAWGPEGFNVNVVDKRTHFDVISNILDTGVGAAAVVETLADHIGVIKTKTYNEISSVDNYVKARTIINVPMNKDGDVFIDGVAYPATKIIAKSTGNVIIDEKQKTQLVVANRQSVSSSKPYTLFVKDQKTGTNHNIQVSKYEGRPMIDMVIMSDTGAMYKYKMDYRMSVLVNDKDVIYIGQSPVVQDTIGRRVDVRKALRSDYQLGIMMYQISSELIRNKVIKPLYSSTIEMLLESGITFEGAMDYCAAMNCVASGGSVSYQPLTSISRMFRNWVPEWFVQIFVDDPDQVYEIANPETDDDRYEALYTLYYAIKEKLNDASWDVLIFCNPMWMTLKDKAFDESNFIYKRCSIELGWNPDTLRSHMFEEATEHYVDKIDMLVNFIEASVLLHQGIGRQEDEKTISQWTATLYEVAMSIFKAEGFNETVDDFVRFKDKLLNNEYFDINEFIPVIAHEAEGCLWDKGLFYGSIYSHTEAIGVSAKDRKVPTPATGVVVVDSVFKEYSLAPSAERRDIAVSGIKFKLYNDLFKKVNPTRIAQISEAMVDSVIRQFITEMKNSNLLFMRDIISDIYCRNATTDCLKMVIATALKTDLEKWTVDEEGNHVIIRQGYPMSIYINKTIDIKYSISAADWEYLTNYAIHEACRVAIPLWEYAYGYYSFQGDKMSWNDIIINASITPWRVYPKKGWNNFTVYNGALNLIPNTTWLNCFRNAAYFKPVNDRGARSPFDLIQLIMSGEQCNYETNVDINAVFKMRAYCDRKHVPQTTTLNKDIIDFYIEEDAGFESILDYKLRYTTHMTDAPEGKVLYHDVLMSDKFFSLFARFYGEEVSKEPVYKDAGTYPHMFITNCNADYSKRSFAPYTIVPEDRTMRLEASVRSGAKVSNVQDIRFDIDTLCKNKKFVYGDFLPKHESILVYPILTVVSEAGNQEYDLSKVTVEDLDFLTQQCIVYQVNKSTFYLKAITGDYIISI